MIAIGARRTELLLPYDGLVSELSAVLREVAAGQLRWIERTHLSNPTGAAFFSMLAADQTVAVHKLVSAHAEGARHGPTVNGLVTVCSAASGLPLILLDGPVLTARRTAAVSALALEMLLPAAASALLIGAGALARAHVEMLAARGIRRLYLSSRTPEHVRRLAQYGRTLGVHCECLEAVPTPPPADVVITVTSSPTPVLARLSAGTRLVIAAGSFKPDMAELGADVVRDAAGIYVDTLSGARREAGELILAGVDWAGVVELAELTDVPPPPLDGYRIFKSVGHSLWDLAAGRLAWRRFSEEALSEGASCSA